MVAAIRGWLRTDSGHFLALSISPYSSSQLAVIQDDYCHDVVNVD